MNPPKFIIKFFSIFRKWKLGTYKKKKVRKEKTIRNRVYFVKFTMRIDDPLNPQRFIKEYEMAVPAKAAFFAKIKAKRAMRHKLEFDFTQCDHMDDEQWDEYYQSAKKYARDKKFEKLTNR